MKLFMQLVIWAQFLDITFLLLLFAFAPVYAVFPTDTTLLTSMYASL